MNMKLVGTVHYARMAGWSQTSVSEMFLLSRYIFWFSYVENHGYTPSDTCRAFKSLRSIRLDHLTDKVSSDREVLGWIPSHVISNNFWNWYICTNCCLSWLSALGSRATTGLTGGSIIWLVLVVSCQCGWGGTVKGHQPPSSRTPSRHYLKSIDNGVYTHIKQSIATLCNFHFNVLP